MILFFFVLIFKKEYFSGMSVITIISDWNKNDYYLASVKGYIYKNLPDAKIVDISHSVQSYNILQAGFLLNSCFRQFPEGSVHIIAIKSEPQPNKSFIACKIDNHFFVSADIGIIGLLSEKRSETVVSISTEDQPYTTFPELHILAPAACKLVQSQNIFNVGILVVKPFRMMPLLPTIEDSVIIGRVMYLDSYFNAITNISLEAFQKVGAGRNYRIFINSNKHEIKALSNTYSESTEGDIFAIFNSLELLEIGIFGGNSSQLLGIDTNSTVRISFTGKAEK